jgi:hypothetical protein
MDIFDFKDESIVKKEIELRFNIKDFYIFDSEIGDNFCNYHGSGNNLMKLDSEKFIKYLGYFNNSLFVWSPCEISAKVFADGKMQINISDNTDKESVLASVIPLFEAGQVSLTGFDKTSHMVVIFGDKNILERSRFFR